MRKLYSNTLIAVILILIFGFAPKKGDQLTQKQQDQIKKEITSVFDSIMTRLERLDAEGTLQYYSPSFLAFGSDGKKADFQVAKKNYLDIISASSSYKWTSYGFNFISISKDKVVISIDGKNETVLKSGEKIIFDPSHYTYAFEKMDGHWRIFYHHFSGTLLK